MTAKKKVNGGGDLPFQNHPVHQAMVFVKNNGAQAYFQATAVCPHLVQLESNHDRFLEFEDYDIWKAAERLANYWTIRCEIFDKQAFVPMPEALSAEEIKFLQQGFRKMAPTLDSKGRLVEFADREQVTSYILTQCSTQFSRIKCQWFVYASLFCCRQQQTNDLVVLFRVVPGWSLLTTSWDREFVQTMARARDSALCIRHIQFHAILVQPPKRCGSYDYCLFQLFFKTLLKCGLLDWRKSSSSPCQYHILDDDDPKQPGALLNVLQADGLSPEHIPTCLGGTWNNQTSQERWLPVLLMQPTASAQTQNNAMQRTTEQPNGVVAAASKKPSLRTPSQQPPAAAAAARPVILLRDHLPKS